MDLLTIYGPSIALAGPQASPLLLLCAKIWGWGPEESSEQGKAEKE